MLMKRFLLFMFCFVASVANAEYQPDSIYQITDSWQDQNATELTLGEFHGKTVVISMAYTSCPHTCPTIVSNMQTIEATLDAKERADVVFVLVSLQPEVDTPAELKRYEEKRSLQAWRLLSGNERSVRTLSMVLNVKFADTPDGEIAHSNMITILDEEGRIKNRLNGLSLPEEFTL